MRLRVVLAILCMLVLLGAKRRAVSPGPRDIKLDLDPSFAVTDPAVLAPFRFARVLNALWREAIRRTRRPFASGGTRRIRSRDSILDAAL